jgi:ACR3 family arsenite transporter
VLPPYFGLQGYAVNIGIGDIAQSVLIYLGIPFAAGFGSRTILRRLKGERGTSRCISHISPITLGPCC